MTKYITGEIESWLLNYRENNSDNAFVLGDWIADVLDEMRLQRGEKKQFFAQCATVSGVSASTCRQRYEVAQKITPALREAFPQFSFSHFRVVAYGRNEGQIYEVLNKVSEMEGDYNGQPISVDALRQHLRQDKDDVVAMAYRKRNSITGAIGKLQDIITNGGVDVVGEEADIVFKRLEKIAFEIEGMEFVFAAEAEREMEVTA